MTWLYPAMSFAAAPAEPDADGWVPPTERQGSLRLSLRRALSRAVRLGSELAQYGRAVRRRRVRDDGTERRAAQGAVAILASLRPWIAALRRKLDLEARIARDTTYLMFARRSWGLGSAPTPAPEGDTPAPEGDAPAPRAARAAGPALPPPDPLVLEARRAQAREARQAAAARARGLDAIVQAMPVEAVAGEMCAALRCAAGLLRRDDLREPVERLADHIERLCARDPEMAPARGRAFEPGTEARVLARIGPVSSTVFDTG